MPQDVEDALLHLISRILAPLDSLLCCLSAPRNLFVCDRHNRSPADWRNARVGSILLCRVRLLLEIVYADKALCRVDEVVNCFLYVLQRGCVVGQVCDLFLRHLGGVVPADGALHWLHSVDFLQELRSN